MAASKASVEKTAGDGVEGMKEFDELRRILDILEKNREPAYLKRIVTIND